MTYLPVTPRLRGMNTILETEKERDQKVQAHFDEGGHDARDIAEKYDFAIEAMWTMLLAMEGK
jgi:hypothetical protein